MQQSEDSASYYVVDETAGERSGPSSGNNNKKGFFKKKSSSSTCAVSLESISLISVSNLFMLTFLTIVFCNSRACVTQRTRERVRVEP
jgi:hypothetical protein